MDSLPLPAQNGKLKPCKKCPRNDDGSYREYPATPEYFHRDKHTPDKLTSSCKKCRTAHTTAYNNEHQAERNAYDKQYYAEHTEASKERNARWSAVPENLEHKHALGRQWYARDIEQNREHARRYFQTDRGKIASRAHSHNRRARARKVGGKQTLAQLLDLLSSQGGQCFYCQTPLATDRGSWHADHVIPLSKGGSNDISNIVIACPSCNRRKHNKLPEEFTKGGG